ncbi:pyridoxamine 5'-phosphate oxidase family protein [Hymenobacter nivis]|uniref:General stress protein n=1 Tax=Hymenobacter nivis TaxID=1850093 RepID=A0A502HCI2_9BACT|nr:pyridoxamine 5'-phosphate oxidase family protein [Hymenobacter nivis]TPG72367.1 general stress protein [Hymenobacter nivis]
MAEQVAVTQDVSKLLDKIKEVKYTTLTTLDARNRLHGRPMYTCQSDNDEVLWFFSEKDAQKITEIRHNAQVGLGYSDPDKATYVTIAGKAEIVDDQHKIKQLWREDFRGFFPKGAEDPNIALIKVTIENGEYWDTPGNVLVRAFAYAKAITTGEKHHATPEEQSKVEPK